MGEQSNRIYRFGPFSLDVAERLLLRNTEPVSLTPKAFETLVVLVENSGHIIEKEELMRRIWPDTFVEEATLAQNIFTLRRILGEKPGEYQYIETVPKRGYRFIAKVEDRLVEDGAQAAGEATTRNSGIRSIAVLPFRLLSQDAFDEYFGVGMADALVTKLSNIRKIIVRPTSAILKYNTPGSEPITAGREMEVDLVLEGKVQKSGDRIRITVQLLNVLNGAPLWADTFDGAFIDIFSLQDTISEQVVTSLTLKLTSNERKLLEKHYTKNSEAYQEYLKGRYHWNKWTEEGFNKSIDHFNRAIEMEPTYAMAYAGLADTYNALAFYGYCPAHQAMPQVKAAAQEALKLDETLAEAHLSLATTLLFYDWNWVAAEREFNLAISLNPSNAMAYQGFGMHLIAMGRFDEAGKNLKRAQELDPVSPLVNTTSGFYLYFAGDYNQAIKHYEKVLELDPTFSLAYVSRGDAYLQKGMYDQAIEDYQRGMALTGRRLNILPSLGYALALSGNKEAALDILKELKEISKEQYVSPFLIAIIYTGLKKKDQAFEWLEKSYEGRSNRLVFLNVQPTFELLRSDKRFADLLKRIGLET